MEVVQMLLINNANTNNADKVCLNKDGVGV